MWGLSGEPAKGTFSMRGAPCVKASVCIEGGRDDTVCCRVAGAEYPGFCLPPTECSAKGAQYDPPAKLPAQLGPEETRADVMLKGAVLGAVAIGIVFLTLQSGRK